MVCSHSQQLTGAKAVCCICTDVASGPPAKQSAGDVLGPPAPLAQRAAGGVSGGKRRHFRRPSRAQSQRPLPPDPAATGGARRSCFRAPAPPRRSTRGGGPSPASSSRMSTSGLCSCSSRSVLARTSGASRNWAAVCTLCGSRCPAKCRRVQVCSSTSAPRCSSQETCTSPAWSISRCMKPSTAWPVKLGSESHSTTGPSRTRAAFSVEPTQMYGTSRVWPHV
mmetsp:Transcript_78322/g.221474  ORF Transcript_78322/g.221474 Transcript_78322/m.221474 type:complete len:223 (-) Transcript_78322:1207-1875(-)